MQDSPAHASADALGPSAIAPVSGRCVAVDRGARMLRANRVVGLTIALVCVAPLLLALWLTPDAHGMGTHEQLGLPPCGLYKSTGFPCATCGMTTAFSLAVHGRFGDAFFTQPAGTLLAIACAAGTWVGLYAAMSGASLAPLGRRGWQPLPVILCVAVIVIAWIYKILCVVGVPNR